MGRKVSLGMKKGQNENIEKMLKTTKDEYLWIMENLDSTTL